MTTWMEQAACRGVDPEWFFPEPAVYPRQALQVCHSCPVQAACYQYARKKIRATTGVWGGVNIAARDTPSNRPCEECGQLITVGYAHRRFCDRTCRRRHGKRAQ